MVSRFSRAALPAFAFMLVLACLPSAALASAITDAGDSIATSLTLQAPKVIAAKETTRVVATLIDEGGLPLQGRLVRIERGTSTISVLATGLTDAAGRFAVKVAPRSKLTLHAHYDGEGDYLPSVGTTVTVTPRVLLSKPWTHDSFAYPGQWLPARGTLWPKHSASSASTYIICQRRESGRWVTKVRYRLSIVNTTKRSLYRGKFRLPSSGSWRVRAQHQDAAHALSLGPSRYIKVTNWRKRYIGHKVGGFKTDRKMVAITIDDGPNSRTLEICSILEKYGARGTFFFTSHLLQRGYESQALKAYLRGHEIENHTANHKMLTGSYSYCYRQAILPKRAIKAAIGFAPNWVRAMGGGVSSTGLRAVFNTGQLYINWSLDSYDSHQRYLPPSRIYHNVVDHVRRGDVILVHQTHPETVAALPAICRELKRRGYKMVTLSELAASSTHR